MRTKNKIEKHLFVSDFQIPEQDDRAITAVLKFIPDFKPHVIHFVGDILDLTKLSKFEPDVYDKHTFMDEISEGRAILNNFSKVARKANKDTQLIYHAGNHEQRQLYALARAKEFADLEIDGELLLSLPHLLQLKKYGIQWVPYHKEYITSGNIFVEHGDIARSHGSYTAKAMLEKRGQSGFSGHTHRLGIHMKTFSGIVKYWVETGCLCRINFKHPYRKSNDWQQGFAIGIYDKETRKMHPHCIPMFDGKFYWEGRFYK